MLTPQPITIKADRCSSCGACAAVCPDDCFIFTPGKPPVPSHTERCELCGHCVSVCPTGAVFHAGLDMEGFEKPAFPLPGADAVLALLLTKRSERVYRTKQVEEAHIETLLKAARMAPSDCNTQERGFIVVQNPELIERIEEIVISFFKKVVFFGPLLRAAGFITERLFSDLKFAVNKNKKGGRHIFRGAPCVIFIYGPKKNPLSRDNCAAAQHYLMLQAHAMGIGTCVNGYAESCAASISRVLKVPRGNIIHTITTVGYPAHSRRLIPPRNKLNVSRL